MKRISFLFGSGVSRASGMPSVGEIGEELFKGNIGAGTDTNFYREGYLNFTRQSYLEYKIIRARKVLDYIWNSVTSFYSESPTAPKHEANYEDVAESLNFNTCLNRKLSIDHNGDICNCPSMKDKYGNHHSKELKQVLDDLNLTKLWSVNKDKIKICSSCEFRYICTDCRAFLSNPNNEFSKPL